jgi:hypothetical protein
MRNKLLVFRSLADDPKGILAAVQRFAPIGSKRRADFFLRVALRGIARLKVRIAAFADTDGREGWLYDSEVALLRNLSLAHRMVRA